MRKKHITTAKPPRFHMGTTQRQYLDSTRGTSRHHPGSYISAACRRKKGFSTYSTHFAVSANSCPKQDSISWDLDPWRASCWSGRENSDSSPSSRFWGRKAL